MFWSSVRFMEPVGFCVQAAFSCSFMLNFKRCGGKNQANLNVGAKIKYIALLCEIHKDNYIFRVFIFGIVVLLDLLEKFQPDPVSDFSLHGARHWSRRAPLPLLRRAVLVWRPPVLKPPGGRRHRPGTGHHPSFQVLRIFHTPDHAPSRDEGPAQK